MEENYFYSPFFARGDVLQMHEHYGDRINPMETIYKALKDESKKCLSLYLTYDYKLAAVNEEYFTDKSEFLYVKRLIENSVANTELYLFFMVSHFGQLVGKPLTLKPEHYHILICRQNALTDIDYDIAINQLCDNLKANNNVVVNLT